MEPETCLDLRGEWQLKADPAGGKTPPDGDAGWSAIRSDDPLLLLYDYYSGSVWLKRNFHAADPAKLNYLHISRNAWHGRVSKVQAAFLNGKPLKDLTHDDPITGDFDECFELGGAVRAGENTIVLKLDGKPVPGYIFLGPKGRWSYPSDDPGLNRLYFDTHRIRVALPDARHRKLAEGDPRRRSAGASPAADGDLGFHRSHFRPLPEIRRDRAGYRTGRSPAGRRGWPATTSRADCRSPANRAMRRAARGRCAR